MKNINIDFKLNGLVPVVIQDYKTKDVLMVGFMDKKALQKTNASGFVWFWSRSKSRLWMKGETSGNRLLVKKIFVDCDKDSLVIKVEVQGSKKVCHTGSYSCFNHVILGNEVTPESKKERILVKARMTSI